MPVISRLNALLCDRWLKRRGMKLSGSILDLRKNASLTLEEGVAIGAALMRFKSLHVGQMTYIRSSAELLNVSRIGRFCSIGNAVVFGQDKVGHPLDWVSSHPFQFTDTALSYAPDVAPLEVGHDVWVGREAIIMEGLKIATGAVIAARAVVTHDVPAYAVVAGIPARIIKYRHSPEIIAGLLSSAWWNLPVGQLTQMPMNDPELFLRECKRLPENPSYAGKTVLLQRQCWQELSTKLTGTCAE